MKHLIYLFLIIPFFAYSQDGAYWQQKTNYKMVIDMDVEKNQFTGDQKIIYTNNSPDQLHNLYFHLYFNAFQPESAMDLRSMNIADADDRVSDRINKLNKDEIGYQKITSLQVRGENVPFDMEGTILEVDLPHPIMPGETLMIAMEYEAQVPIQIRRNGRDNAEGIRYSMSQWYPRLAEYDEMGWHPNPYIGREFHGTWGDYDVTINIDKDYILGASGILQNPDEIGYGYGKEPKKRKKKLSWNFLAENVIDFMWAADPDYVHDVYEAHDGTILHFLYQPGEKTTENWKKLPGVMDEALKYMNEEWGKYPYPVYSFIQGGDGGMEYPMGTLITGVRSFPSLVGVSVHEWMHSWYQFMLASNEALYAWMDEGFTTYGSAYTMNHLKEVGAMQGDAVDNPMVSRVRGFAGWTTSGLDEPLTTHADHFNTNAAYGVGSYNKGSIYLEQLKYIIGEEDFAKGMLRYFDEWRYKHPNPDRFIRVMEKESGMILDWYNEYWVNTTKYPEYAIDTVMNDKIVLKQNGLMPMPIELVATYEDGTKKVYYIPLTIMRKDKPNTWGSDYQYEQLRDWVWTNPTYEINVNTKAIKTLEINPQQNFVDLDRDNNKWERN